MKILHSFFSVIFIFLLVQKAYSTTPSYQMYMYENQGDKDVYYLDSDSDAELISDPFITVNKHIFSFNSTMDTVFIAPFTHMYLTAVPKHGRECVGNFVKNIGEPLNFINLMFQGKFDQAGVTLGRFITNTVLGFFGILDVATDFKMEYKSEDFGQTLAHYGAPIGPYIVLPILGPSSVRDTAGRAFDSIIDPVGREADSSENVALNLLKGVHKRAKANDIIKYVNNSLNPYETAKALYIQNRMDQIND